MPTPAPLRGWRNEPQFEMSSQHQVSLPSALLLYQLMIGAAGFSLKGVWDRFILSTVWPNCNFYKWNILTGGVPRFPDGNERTNTMRSNTYVPAQALPETNSYAGKLSHANARRPE